MLLSSSICLGWEPTVARDTRSSPSSNTFLIFVGRKAVHVNAAAKTCRRPRMPLTSQRQTLQLFAGQLTECFAVPIVERRIKMCQLLLNRLSRISLRRPGIVTGCVAVGSSESFPMAVGWLVGPGAVGSESRLGEQAAEKDKAQHRRCRSAREIATHTSRW